MDKYYSIIIFISEIESPCRFLYAYFNMYIFIYVHIYITYVYLYHKYCIREKFGLNLIKEMAKTRVEGDLNVLM